MVPLCMAGLGSEVKVVGKIGHHLCVFQGTMEFSRTQTNWFDLRYEMYCL